MNLFSSLQALIGRLRRPRNEDDHISKTDMLDDEFRESYFRQLVGQFNAIGPDVVDPQARQLGQQIASKPAKSIEWDDVYQLELIILRLEPEASLRQLAWSLRGEFESVAPDDYKKYQAAKPPPPSADTTDLNLLRADLVRVQIELNWFYTVLWIQEQYRSLLLKQVARRTIGYILLYLCIGLILGAGTLLTGAVNVGTRHVAESVAKTNNAVDPMNVHPDAGHNPSLPDANPTKTVDWQRGWAKVSADQTVFRTYWLVAFVGTIGALISVLRRIQNMSLRGNPDTNLVQLEQSSTSIYYSPLLGAVFALILLFAFMGQLLSGTLFPKLPEHDGGFFLGCVPDGCVDMAKLLIWSFIAGFAEQFVPDTLDKMQKESTTGKTGSGAKT
jgi:hypothetical protein